MTRLSISSARMLLCAAIFATGAAPLAAQAAPQCKSCGTVVSSHTYEREPERASGVGAATGAVVGGLLGNQIGDGNGRTLATVAGAVGGGYAGNRVERHMKRKTYTDVKVKMARGGTRTFTELGKARFRNGTAVRVTEKGLVRDE